MSKASSKSAIITDPSQLTGPEKAAIVLLTLGEDHTAIWQMLDEEEIREVSQAMATLGNVNSSVVEALLVEFISNVSGGGTVMGSFEQTQRLLASFLDPDKVDNLMEEIRGPAGRTMWDKLGNVSEGVLANYLKNEYPQTVAVVLSKIKPDHASRVLGALPEDFAMECVTRMLRMEPVQREILDKIEQTLRTEFMSNLARTSKRDSHEMMAEIFNSFDRQTETRFISALEERNRDSAERIRASCSSSRTCPSWIPAASRPFFGRSTRPSWAWPLRALRKTSGTSSSRTCPSAPRGSCGRTWRTWVRCAFAMSTRPRWPWSSRRRTWHRRARSCWPAPAAMTS